MAHDASMPGRRIELSVIAPAHNEAENVEGLVEQVGAAIRASGLDGEFIIVDDGSTDDTRARIASMLDGRPWLRCIAMSDTPPGRGNGQSAAFHAGVRAARGALIATIDADLQNDPADLPALIELLRSSGAEMAQGDRSHARQDNAIRRMTSVIGRFFRSLILADVVRDTGCSLRVMKREVALALPLEFRGMHRFIPITAVKLGHRVVEMPVRHRARVAGQTKYGLGILPRAIPGLIDCFAVRWMASRRRPVDAVEVTNHPGAKAPDAERSHAPAVTVPAGDRGARLSESAS
ncbi:MAG: glycosyltransferase [Phycisphaerales bacterium]